MTTEEMLKRYIDAIDKEWRTGSATEHSYRPALKELFTALRPDLLTQNESKHINCGAPDYIIFKNNMPLAFVEAKDVDDNDLDGKKLKGGNKEQFDRYKASLTHIAFTDYLDFHFYEKGEFVGSVRIGEIKHNHIVLVKDNVDEFVARVGELVSGAVQPITSAKKLAQLMAAKARLLEQIALKLLDATSGQQTGIQNLMRVFKQALIPDIDAKEFADIYAQTLTYGLFAARLHDETPETFSRHEAMDLIPKSNPFLKALFIYIGTQLESELEWVVDDLISMFGATNIQTILKDYGKAEAKRDPMIHFYEDFLSAYDAGLKKNRGVWYTPLPVVKFIVGAVDAILEKDFNLHDGLANSDKVAIKVEHDTQSGRKAVVTTTETVHKVQVLDPATGTGTFLAECINRIHERKANQQGTWNDYVTKDLLPRLNGFEILMASYTMAHVKLDCVLSNTGYVHPQDKRFNVFLTNSLEQYAESNGLLFAFALGEEANAAKFVKKDCPVMVVMGNPPYSGESQNKSDYIMDLMEAYKKEPGGIVKLKERNPKWINDDYVKFIRLSQEYICRNGSGIVAFINPHGFLDNPTFRGMRWNLLKTFDDIYVLNLHGNSKKKETAPDGSKDENVFDIMQGVSINIFVKNGRARSPIAPHDLARVHYADLYGKRQDKFQFLETHSLDDAGYCDVIPTAPMYFFVPKNTEGEEEYKKGFRIDELITESSTGILTGNDALNISFTEEEQQEKINEIRSLSEENWRLKNGKMTDSRDWKYESAKKDASCPNMRYILCDYRPFDLRYTAYTGNSKGLYINPRKSVMRNVVHDENVILLTCKQLAVNDWRHISIAEHIVDDCRVSNRTKERGYVFPLYLYQENMGQVEKVPNFKKEIYEKICEAVGNVSPEDVFDYIYGVLHTPEYREKYKEFLKVDFPRIPYPKNVEVFKKLVECGTTLRQTHLLKDPHLQDGSTIAFPISGDNIIGNVKWENNRVYINDAQYFENVPESAFNFWIGGYQPAQKWLKDRKGRELGDADNTHYRAIINALLKTQAIMTQLSELSTEWLPPQRESVVRCMNSMLA